MNIPEIYLVEPYNAYAPKQNKKHWHQIVEEQAMLARIQAEQIALMESSKNPTLPPNTPSPTTPIVGPAAGAGAGGMYPPQVFNPPPSSAISFSVSPITAAGPVTVQFNNLTPNLELYRYNWTFSDGQTSTLVSPSIVFQSGSSATALITASFSITSSVFGTPVGSSSRVFISASKPTVTAGFTLVSSSNSAPSTITFTNTSVNTSQTPSTTYLWTFGTSSLTSSATSPTSVTYTAAGPFTASLQATGSYGLASVITRSFRLT